MFSWAGGNLCFGSFEKDRLFGDPYNSFCIDQGSSLVWVIKTEFFEGHIRNQTMNYPSESRAANSPIPLVTLSQYHFFLAEKYHGTAQVHQPLPPDLTEK